MTARITGDGWVDSVLMCEGDVLVAITGDRLGSCVMCDPGSPHTPRTGNQSELLCHAVTLSRCHAVTGDNVGFLGSVRYLQSSAIRHDMDQAQELNILMLLSGRGFFQRMTREAKGHKERAGCLAQCLIACSFLIIESTSHFHSYLLRLAQCLNSVLSVKGLVGALVPSL